MKLIELAGVMGTNWVKCPIDPTIEGELDRLNDEVRQILGDDGETITIVEADGTEEAAETWEYTTAAEGLAAIEEWVDASRDQMDDDSESDED